MRRAALAAATLLLAPGLSRAQVTGALRLGWAPAFGDLARDVPISEAMSSQLATQLDLLLRRGHLEAGAYGSWGLGQLGRDGCPSGSCSASALRLGLQGLWAFDPISDGRILPWAGVGAGWEWAFQTRERLGSRTSWTWSGPELSLQGGAEWAIGDRFGVGPVLLAGFGRYATEALDTAGSSQSAAIPSRAVHVWLHLGVRGRADF